MSAWPGVAIPSAAGLAYSLLATPTAGNQGLLKQHANVGVGGRGHPFHVPAAHWWLSGNVKLGLIWGSVVHCDVFVLVCCAFCMLGNVHLMFLEDLDTQ